MSAGFGLQYSNEKKMTAFSPGGDSDMEDEALESPLVRNRFTCQNFTYIDCDLFNQENYDVNTARWISGQPGPKITAFSPTLPTDEPVQQSLGKQLFSPRVKRFTPSFLNLGYFTTNVNGRNNIIKYRVLQTMTAGAYLLVLNVTAISANVLKIGDIITGVGVAPGQRIASFASGTGGTGTYNLTVNQPDAIISITMTASSEYTAEIPPFNYTKVLSTGAPYTHLATFTGSISTTTLTVTAIASGIIQRGDYISGAGIVAGTRITDYGTGSGGTGTYIINYTQTVGSETMTTSDGIVGFNTNPTLPPNTIDAYGRPLISYPGGGDLQDGFITWVLWALNTARDRNNIVFPIATYGTWKFEFTSGVDYNDMVTASAQRTILPYQDASLQWTVGNAVFGNFYLDLAGVKKRFVWSGGSIFNYGRHLLGLKPVPNAVMQAPGDPANYITSRFFIGPIEMMYTRYIDICSNTLTQFSKLKSGGNGAPSNLLLRVYLNEIQDFPRQLTLLLDGFHQQQINMRKDFSMNDVDIFILDEYGLPLSIPQKDANGSYVSIGLNGQL